MKFIQNTSFKPVASKEVAKLRKALKRSGYVANVMALETIAHIAKRRTAPPRQT